MQCDNCERPAIYVYAPRMITPAHYCDRHLPSFLRSQIRTGLVQTTEAYADTRREALSKLATRREPEPAAEVVETPVAEDSEEVADTEPVAEKPKRRRRPRKAAVAPEETDET